MMRSTAATTFLLGLALCAVAVMAQSIVPNNIVWSTDGCVESAPGIPQYLTATAKSQTEILISWKAPAGDTCIDAFAYSVVERGGAEPNPNSAPRVQALSVLVQGLTPNTEYTVKVAAYNRAKGAGGFATQIVRTMNVCINSAPGPVGNIYLVSTDVATTWRLSWMAPNSGGCTGDFWVDVLNVDSNRVIFNAASRTGEIAVPNLIPGTTYNFRVSARNNFGTGPARRATYTIPAATIIRPLGKGTIVEYTEKNTQLEPVAEAGSA